MIIQFILCLLIQLSWTAYCYFFSIHSIYVIAINIVAIIYSLIKINDIVDIGLKLDMAYLAIVSIPMAIMIAHISSMENRLINHALQQFGHKPIIGLPFGDNPDVYNIMLHDYTISVLIPPIFATIAYAFKFFNEPR